jgi:hypothetical protein
MAARSPYGSDSAIQVLQASLQGQVLGDRRLPARKTSTGIRDVGQSQSLRQSLALRYSLVSLSHKGSGYVGRRGHHRVAEVGVLL